MADPQGLLPPSADAAVEECRALFGAGPAAATGPRHSAREALDHAPVPVVYVEGGKDPSAGVLHDPGHRVANGTYLFVPEARHCPDLADPRVGERVLSEMLRLAKIDGPPPARPTTKGASRE
ncbi:MAG: hypothetical protein HZB55_11315 [Deltaproteobacteria bacterium]|nr:hypothetical protein [Deltaproteobacteria bacterium]